MQRYTDEEVEKWRAQISDSRRLWFLGGPAVVVGLGFIPHFQILVLVGIAALFIGFIYFDEPRRRLKGYDDLVLRWGAVMRRSDPNLSIAVTFRLRDGEVVHYAEYGQRLEERKTGQLINTQTRTKNAVASAAVGGILFGPAGAIIGGGMARRQTTGTATDVYDVVPVDEGDVVVTSFRFLFMGQRNTVDVPLDGIMRWGSVQGTNRVIVEYAGRLSGECYTVDPLLFSACMARRAQNPAFLVPDPPAPLPISYAIPLADRAQHQSLA